MNVFRKQKYLQIAFDNGEQFVTDNCTEELWNSINEHFDDEDTLLAMLVPEIPEVSGTVVREKVASSRILTLKGNSVYMLEVSELSIPEDFALKILEAEEREDELEVKKYKNFWTLVSLNPDSSVRDNIFWFIRRWNMNIAESGLIVAYRNADIKVEAKYNTEETKDIINRYYEAKYLENIDPETIVYNYRGMYDINLAEAYSDIINGEASPIYTDHHSHTTTIVLGRPVSIPREECDSDSNVSCSRGLHCSSKGWLKRNYFGGVGLQVLVNPANIVAIPTIDDYGKMRCCEYFPVALIDFDENGDVKEKPYNLHNDINYLKQIRYDGTINNVDVNHYELSNNYTSNEELYDSILVRLKS